MSNEKLKERKREDSNSIVPIKENTSKWPGLNTIETDNEQ